MFLAWGKYSSNFNYDDDGDIFLLEKTGPSQLFALARSLPNQSLWSWEWCSALNSQSPQPLLFPMDLVAGMRVPQPRGRSFTAGSAHTPCGRNFGGFQPGKQTVWLFNLKIAPQSPSRSWRGSGKTRNTWVESCAYTSCSPNLLLLFGIIQRGSLNNLKMWLC